MFICGLNSFDELGQLKPEIKPMGQVIKTGTRNSERLIFCLCYLVPVLYATWQIWKLDRRLKKIESEN